MDRTFDYLIVAIALISGIMLVTGHGDFFMKGGNRDRRKSIYDEAKMEKSSGVALILIGAATLVDCYTTSLTAKFIYIGVLVVIIVGLLLYLRYKCRKQ